MSICSYSTRAEDYWTSDCYLPFSNGMTIYYNFTGPFQSDCDCVCPFKGDPDIAGPGVRLMSHCFIARGADGF
jgi:hypothetical protein